jgi:hypothetical protein
MAGENRGKAVEAIVRLAIEELKGASVPSDAKIIWDEPSAPLSWKPDIYIPASDGFGGLLVLVTFAGSETDSRQKFWRNLAEYFDAKTRIPSICTVSILAGARVRDKLLETQQHIFNGVLQFEDHAPLANVARWIAALTGKKATSASLMMQAKDLAASDVEFRKLVSAVRNAIEKAIKAPPSLHASFWTTGSKGHTRIPASVTSTAYRRGVAKALLFSKEELALLCAGKRLPEKARHAALLRGQIVSRSISGIALADEEIRFAISNVPNLVQLIDVGTTAVGVSARERIWELGMLEEALDWCRKNWTVCADEKQVENGLLQVKSSWPSPHVLYGALKTTLALKLGRQGQAWLEDVADKSTEMRSILVGLILPKFERGASPLPAHVAKSVASALASRAQLIDPLSDEEMDKALDSYVSGEIEARLVCHGIDPVGGLISQSLKDAGINWRKGRLPSGVAERLGYSERDLGTGGMIAGTSTFIHWKTVTDQGRDHKVKELFARSFQGGRCWNGKQYAPRAVKRLLVIDGTWGAADFDALASVWDGLYYPNELGELAKAIV